MRKTLLSLLLLCLFHFSRGQHKLPSLDFTPQSPSAAAFTKYGDIPVDMSTGVPDVSIPIYTLNSHGIKVPISLSYHASGIKVQDVASQVGLGWTLNAGGVITRTVLGSEDEHVGDGVTYRPRWRDAALFQEWGQTYALSSGRYDAGYNLYYMDLLHKSETDYYSDRFYYSLGNGESGIFRKDFETGDIRMMPYRPLMVKLNLVYTGGSIEITADDGTIYYFNGHYDQWSLSKIVNGNKTDSVLFYSHVEVSRSNISNDKSFFSAFNTMTTPRYEPELVPTGYHDGCYYMERNPVVMEERNQTGTSTFGEVMLMDSIVSSEAVVRFSYLQDRTDYRLAGMADPPKARLTKVQVFNRTYGVSIKEVNFNQSYFTDPAHLDDYRIKRLRLDNVQMGANGEEKYTFGYNSTPLPPYFDGTNTFNNFYNEDFWGYYNGPNGNVTCLYNEFTPSGVPNLFPNEEYAKACMLEEIKYPTGGKTVFEYESNRVNRNIYGYGFSSSLVPADGKVGGLRVKKISTYAYEGAVPQVKQYAYEIDWPNYANRDLSVSKFAYTQETFNNYNIPDPSSPCKGTENSFYTTRNVAFARPMGYVIGTSEAPLVYSRVTEYYGDANANTGKTIYSYDQGPPLDQEQFNDEPRFQGPYWRDWGNYEPHLENKEEYKNDNGTYKLVRKTSISYTNTNEQAFHTGFNLESDLNFVDLTINAFDHSFDRYNNEVQDGGLAEYYYNTIHFSDCIGHTGLKLPATTEVYDYDDNGHYVKTTTSYEYNGYGQQIAANVTTSKGDVLKTKTTYPVDYPTQAPYTTMIERNILSPVIEQTTYKNTYDPGNFLQSTKTNFNYWDNGSQTWGNSASNQILPQTVETQKGTNAKETRIQYFAYDGMDNPVLVGKENDVRQLFIWGYNKTSPIAQVLNVPESEQANVAYTSFEDEGTGNWTITGSNGSTSFPPNPTGNRCMHIGTGNELSKTLSPSTNYILSYWYRSGTTVNVSGNSTVLSSISKNGWVFVKRKITGASSVSITGFGYLDEVRLYPEMAQMNTYTYNPLVGITSQCDVNDRITNYTYDASGRLTLVKDEDGNVLKKICYNFQGQPDACGDNAIPLWQTTGVTRCKPCPQNSNYISNIKQQEEKDNNSNSATYGNTRWVDAGVSINCVIQPGWQKTANTRCVIVNNQNTGAQEQEQMDVNPCSSGYGQTRWVSAGTNTTACPLPVVFRSLAINKYYFNQNCGPQQVPLPYLVNLPEGAFTSSNNATEANALAEQEAQRQANASGGCATLYVKLTTENEQTDPDGEFTVGSLHYRFFKDAAGTIPFTLPIDVTINTYERYYETENGQITYDQTSGPESAIWDNDSRSEIIITDHITAHCYYSVCSYYQTRLAPGRYVIIP